ncbi:GntR family transcriptional regulator [Jiangella asiatica]|uniref:GntR family transcriptional regulator n=1 Tax=Jiangella asiatica TaxID=2530372 RepID=A0A4V2Z246_9ACTN|nr:GntR family transcriptional regulator [Jiangella asiatica]TDE07448.1 GntR family transcriptional regulator [Jiangella asiatica]
MADIYRPVRPPAPLREQVYESLEELILDGRLKAGERLVESDLAARLGVSRGPIREALQHLERDGWLEVRPRQGTYVREPQPDELQDYFWARKLLEVEAAGRAARRVRTSPDAAAPGLERLRRIVAKSEELTVGLPPKGVTDLTPEQAERRRQYRENSRQFHYAVGELSGSPALVELLVFLGKRTRWYFSSLGYNSRLDEHKALLGAIEQGDEDTVMSLMREHMDSMTSTSLAEIRSHA